MVPFNFYIFCSNRIVSKYKKYKEHKTQSIYQMANDRVWSQNALFISIVCVCLYGL